MSNNSSVIEARFIENIERDLVESKRKDGKPLYDLWKEEYYKKLFYDDLYLVGGAYSVLEKFSDRPLLLFRKEFNHNTDVKGSDFFWFPYEAKYYQEEHATIIDRLFITTRESQNLSDNSPDFICHINSEDYRFKKLTNQIFKHKSFPVIYCDSSEILVFLFCYIFLLEKLDGVGPIEWNDNSVEAISILRNDALTIDIVKEFMKEAIQAGKTFLDFFCSEIDLTHIAVHYP